MAMDVVSLVSFSREIGSILIKECKVAKQYQKEATRIAALTSRVLGSLESASSKFSDQEWFQGSMLEMKRALEDAHDLVDKCKKPRTMFQRATAVMRANNLKDGLKVVEAELERITENLKIKLPVGIGMKRAATAIVGRVNSSMMAGLDAEAAMRAGMQEMVRQQELISPTSFKSADDPPGPEDGFIQLGSVRYDILEEDEDDILGEGTFGIVVSGTFEGEEVAIKKARGPVGDRTILTAFRREAQIHYATRHENVVRVLGFNVDDLQRPPCLVMEIMDKSLHQYIQTMAISPSLVERLDIVNGVVKGLQFLHGRRIIHGDVKSLNVLLDNKGTAKLSDFGLAAINSSVARSTNAPVRNQGGSIPWMAPEVFNGTKATCASDVFSVHVVVWEVLEHRTADSRSVAIGEDLFRFGDAQLSLSGADSTPALARMQALLTRCGSLDSKKRPSMADVAREVRKIVRLIDMASTPPAAYDRAVLTTLLETWGGLQSSKGGSWRSDRELSAWDGVTVDLDGRVTELRLNNCGLHGAIPPDIEGLTALRELHINYNGITGAIPPEIGGLTALQKLYLNNNSLTGRDENQEYRSGQQHVTGAIPPEIAGLTALQVLHLHRNKLTGTIPPEIGGLTALQELRLDDNELFGRIQPALGKLTALTRLSLDHNELSGGIPMALGKLTALRRLDVNDLDLIGTKADVQQVVPGGCAVRL
ncbi:unnamed protein product [Pylaiella littoralis]